MAKKIKEKQESKFTKQQILAASKYNNRRDALNAILQDDKSYSISEVNSLLENWLKGKVK